MTDNEIGDVMAKDGADPFLVSKFIAFHRKNPAVYEKFCEFAQQALITGRPHFSHWMIVQRIRWYTTVETTGSRFKVSNDFIALYGRMLVAEQPAYLGFFSFKPMKRNRSSSE